MNVLLYHSGIQTKKTIVDGIFDVLYFHNVKYYKFTLKINVQIYEIYQEKY